MGLLALEKQAAASVDNAEVGELNLFVDVADNLVKTKDEVGTVRPASVGTADELATTGAPVDVSASSPPAAGYGLVAGSATAAAWGPVANRYRQAVPAVAGASYVTNFTTGTGNIILPGPPAGFVRKTVLGGGGVVFPWNNTGGPIDADILLDGNIVGRRTAVADGNRASILGNGVFLANGQDLTLDINSGGGGGGVVSVVHYQDIPDTEITPFIVTIGLTPTTIIPVAPAGFVHLMDIGAEEAHFFFINTNGAAVDVAEFIGTEQLGPLGNIGSFNTGGDIGSSGLAVGDTDDFNATASVDAVVTAFGAYRVLPAAP